MSLVSRIEAKLQRQRHEPSAATTKQATPFWRSRSERAQRSVMHATRTCSTEASDSQKTAASLPNHVDTIPVADVLFATHDAWGIIDTGATKTVMGSKFVPEFLKSLKPHIRKQVQRCSCDVVFRFGNQGTLSSTHAMVVPVGGLHLKIAIVPGSTPFLVSNTLIRALGAVVDTQRNRLTLPKYQCEIPLELAEKGLYLIDTNDLFDVTTAQNHPNAIAETFAQDSDPAAETVQPTGPQEEHRDTHEVSKITNQSDEKGQRSQVFNPEVTNPTCRNHITMPASPNMPPANSRPTQVSRISSETSDIRQCNEPRLDSTSPEGSDRDGEARSRADRSPDVGRSSERACDVWQTPSREIPRGGVAKQSRLDKVVSVTLQHQPDIGSPPYDQIHPAEDRTGREGGHPAVQCQQPAKGQGQGDGATAECPAQEPGDAYSGASDARRNDVPTGRFDRGNAMGARGPPVGGDAEPPTSNAEPRECHATDHQPSGTRAYESVECSRVPRCDGGGSMDGSMEPISDWVLKAGEIDEFCESIPNGERVRFWKLVSTIETELDEIAKKTKPMGKSIDLIEVFCSSQSTLTDQITKQGGTAMRFGLDQGDLQTAEGRQILFTQMARHRPKHVWLSPRCAPWSSWSRFNMQRSIDTWDKIQSDRITMLSQVAMCLVLCRYQHRSQNHVHWEQPKGSLMLKLPYVQEIYRYMNAARPDMCHAGELRDPSNNMLMKKGMEILTTSRHVHDTLDPLKCTGDHHQAIEGTTQTMQGSVARSAWSELYPRKFSRLVAKALLKRWVHPEKPMGHLPDSALMMFDAICHADKAFATDGRAAKRRKQNQPRGTKSFAAARPSEEGPMLKRTKVQEGSESERMPDPPMSRAENQSMDEARLIVQEVEKVLPRVGKRVIDQPKIINMVQKLFHDKEIKGILACKGTDRRYGPPKTITPAEAPYRRSIMKHRETLETIMDEEWEKYDEISNRKLIRKSPPCRISITVFAANPALPTSVHNSCPAESAKPDSPSSVPQVTPEVPARDTSPENAKGSKGEEISEEKTPETPEDKKEDQETAMEKERPDVESHGPRFRALPKEEQAMIKRAHQNLCHPSHEQLGSVLRAQGCRPEIIQALPDLRCPTCVACQRPKVARPSTLKHELDFNDKIFVDGVSWTNSQGNMFHFYHVLDQATNYHVAVPAPSRAAEQAIQKLSEAWFLWAGPPNAVVTDPATEFTSEVFERFLQRHDVKRITTAEHAHWQNGRCERHGQVLQHMLKDRQRHANPNIHRSPASLDPEHSCQELTEHS